MTVDATISNAILDEASCPDGDRAWVAWAIDRLDADRARSADTHLLRLPIRTPGGVDLYLKDESVHPTGSLKHRLARSLFLYALCNGDVREGTLIVEASSGSTAISEAYFARLLGLPFLAVVPHGTTPSKIIEIERQGGECHQAPSDRIYEEARRIADAAPGPAGGHYMDQFTLAERATDWRGNNNVAESLFGQMAREPHPVPAWIVVGAGTGGTSATIGRYLRYQGERLVGTRLCVADPEGSAFFGGFAGRDQAGGPHASRLEGVGRPRVEPSFCPGVVDRMLRVSDEASIAACWWLEARTGRRYGGSTGLNVVAALHLAEELAAEGRVGSVVSLICDEGRRYAQTIFDRDWVVRHDLDPAPFTRSLEARYG